MQEFTCELALRSTGLVVVRFAVPAGASFRTPVPLPPGTVSWGFFWQRRPYNLYRFVAPDGEAFLHRFDAIADLSIGETAVEYRDLALDWWVLPGESIVEEDREELEAALSAGLLSEADGRRAAEATAAVYGRYRHIIDEAARLQAKAS